MTPAALGFAAGAALLQLQPALPGLPWLGLLPACLLLSFLKLPFLGRAVPLFACAAGFLWAASFAHWRLADRLDPSLEGRDLALIGVVRGLPAANERAVRFELEVESGPRGERLPRRIALNWYPGSLREKESAPPLPRLHPGERWLLTVRLRRPHGQVNPHGFDYEAWLLERGIGATGYVRERGERRRLGRRDSPMDRIAQAREAVRERFRGVLGETPAAGIVAALAVGEQRAISREEWQLFNRTGVTHLMSISGLHVTLVSGLAALLAAALWRRVPALALRVPARKPAAAAAILAALGYTMLAGFAVPAQRTFWMVSVVAAALWAGRIASPWRTLSIALAAVVIADPWAPLAPGLWLSFGAVALIFYVGAGWSAPEPRLAQWVRMQWAITVGLAPAALLLFNQVSIAGPLANALAIPVVSVVITPLVLLAALVPFDFLLDLAAWLVQWLLEYLEWCASLPSALWQGRAPPLWSVPLALMGAAWILAPRGIPWRAGGVALMAPAFALPPSVPRHGEAWITVFDVGQGLAVLARTSSRALLYDAGPSYGPDADSGSRVVVPALRGAGVPRLDLMVVTHEDTDHLGGALSVLETLEVDALASSLAPRHALNAFVPAPRRCAAGQSWQWDGVRFEFLHPAASPFPARRNDLSCVLRISTAGASILLTGDIELQAETEILARTRNLAADVLLVPHHGSRTSSSPEFLAAVSPRWAIVPAGYANRFGHPGAQILERYRAIGAQVLRTDLDGAVTVVLNSEVSITAERARRGRYWLQ